MNRRSFIAGVAALAAVPSALALAPKTKPAGVALILRRVNIYRPDFSGGDTPKDFIRGEFIFNAPFKELRKGDIFTTADLKDRRFMAVNDPVATANPEKEGNWWVMTEDYQDQTGLTKALDWQFDGTYGVKMASV